MKSAIAKILNLRMDEFDFEVNGDEDENEVIVWGDRIDTIVITLDNL